MTHRLFAAVLPPAEVVAALRAQVVDHGEPTRWTPPAQWHVTLLFTPAVDDAALPGLVEGIATMARRLAPFRLAVAGGGAFPRLDRARHLVALLDDSSGSLPRLNQGISGVADHLGIDHGDGPYQPHLTLARINRPSDRQRDAGWLEGLATPTWQVDRIALVESFLDGPGRRARHVVAEQFPLGDA